MRGLMIRQQRAKQFQPFDAMKGLSEALRDREERHCREYKRELSEETVKKIEDALLRVENGVRVRIEYYKAFHSVVMRGEITKINRSYKFLQINDEKIYFEDIYDLTVTDFNK